MLRLDVLPRLGPVAQPGVMCLASGRMPRAQTPCVALPNPQCLIGNTGACLVCLVSDPVPVGELYSITSVCSHTFQNLIRLLMLRKRFCVQSGVLGICRAYRKENKSHDTDGVWATKEIWIASLELSS